MAHGEVFKDLDGKFGYTLVWDGRPTEILPDRFDTAEEAHEAAAHDRPLTIVPFQNPDEEPAPRARRQPST
jgi:hypothetical protein